MKVNQVAHIWPKLSPVRSPLVGKRWSINSITRTFNSSANMTGMSSIRSWTALTFVGILPTYLNFYNRERFERQRGNHRRAVALDSRRQALHFRNPAL